MEVMRTIQYIMYRYIWVYTFNICSDFILNDVKIQKYVRYYVYYYICITNILHIPIGTLFFFPKI